MKSRIVLLVLAAGLAVACRSEAEKPQPAPKTVAAPAHAAQPVQPVQVESRADRLAKITKDYGDAMTAYQTAFEKALGDNKNPSREDLAKIEETVKEPDPKVYLARAQQLLDEDMKDITAFKTIQWMLRSSSEQEAQKTLIGLLERHHVDRAEMGDLCNQLAQNGRGLLEKLAASSPHAEVRGRACYALAEGLKSDIQTAGYIKGKSQEELDGMKGWLGDEKLAALQNLDADKTQAQIEQLYERIAKEYGDVVVGKGSKRETTLGKQAASGLYEIRNLAVGKPVPEIEGSDLDSVAFKLSEYRGKVVLLDFWGNW